MSTTETAHLSEEEQSTVGLGRAVLADPSTTVLSARGLIKTFGKVIGLDGVDLDLFPGEVLSVIGDNGAGKSTLIKALTGALIPDAGQVYLDGQEVHFKAPQDARQAGIETVYQTLAVAPALDIAANMFLGRERRRTGPLGTVFRMLDKNGMKADAGKSMANLGIATVQNMSPGRRDAVRRPAAGGGGRPGGDVRHQVRGARRADRGARRQGDRSGAEPDPADQGEGPACHPDQPQHAERVRGRGPDPHRPAGRLRRRDHPEVAHPDRGGGDHDRRHHAAEGLTRHPAVRTAGSGPPRTAGA